MLARANSQSHGAMSSDIGYDRGVPRRQQPAATTGPSMRRYWDERNGAVRRRRRKREKCDFHRRRLSFFCLFFSPLSTDPRFWLGPPLANQAFQPDRRATSPPDRSLPIDNRGRLDSGPRWDRPSHPCIPVRTHIGTYIHTYVHTYRPTYRPTYRYAYPTCSNSKEGEGKGEGGVRAAVAASEDA
ncbi:hypothetical protein F4803DRAFT_91745 [Xylaria telfairii]|nr:hypothetical protein F4803DRAFT_91745 [Xylaria telfairii]